MCFWSLFFAGYLIRNCGSIEKRSVHCYLPPKMAPRIYLWIPSNQYWQISQTAATELQVRQRHLCKTLFCDGWAMVTRPNPNMSCYIVSKCPLYQNKKNTHILQGPVWLEGCTLRILVKFTKHVCTYRVSCSSARFLGPNLIPETS